ncbi:hypothetical protein [Allorhodopirellula heiligendammensis]|uniref:hypothetical protein n=1 Tax=Allorhodopirellula heiligendammensis TaxID=2714739 RepID=UPI0026603D90|nr:hypothetical protein [Allorhodopirellula heiligendammensis]
MTQFVWVRALFFDQPRDRTWASAWHKDISISVKDNSIASGGRPHKSEHVAASLPNASN